VNARVAQDLADLRFAFTDDSAFAAAVEAVANDLARAVVSPHTWGKTLEHGLTGWRRSAFSSRPEGDTDLRLLFRPRQDSGIDVLMFGLRRDPDTTSIYHAATARI
jgi:hypothetical protein